jgi:hypothetical protein
MANVALALVFAGMSYLVLWTLSSISTEITFLLQIGLLLVAGIFLVRTLFDALTIVDYVTVPLFSELSNFGPLLQEITTYAALGLILLFVYDIGRTFYRITEEKANSVANRISHSSNDGEK